MYEAESGQTSIALAGDVLLTRPLSVFREESYLRLRQLLHAADARFCNLEASVHRYLDGQHAQRQGGGTYMTTEPGLLDDLKWLGINMLACGSSHADDYGWTGVMETLDYLDRADIVHAGSGRHLAEARAPSFLDTPRGRIALHAANGQFNPGARAGEQRRDTLGHPGVNGVRHYECYDIDRALMDDLRRVGQAIGLGAAEERGANQGEPGQERGEGRYDFLGTRFAIGDQPAIHSYAHQSDIRENMRQIGAARAMADRVIASLHNHDQGGPTYLAAGKRSEVEDPADYAIDYAHSAIEAGADVFVGHGPQVPLAVEVYKGRPVFHGMGAFIFTIETLRYLPEEAYERYGLDERATPADFVLTRYANDTRGHTAHREQWEQLFAVCDFAGDALKEIRLHPIELGFGKPRSQRGRPVLAEAEAAERIISRVARLSSKYGTHVDLKDGIGVIR
ncbi:MAG TPA: CapA family protein [Chloroflexota bacterium]|nr:CapA family protein [Chloroflexota bacterium]